MIRGVIIDVDGVVIGEKVGFNFPDPHPDVVRRLQELGEEGVHVSLCTAKPHFSIGNIVAAADLRSPHITDGGGVIIDPLNNIIRKSHFIGKQVAREIVAACLENGTYVEIYTVNEYFAQADQCGDETDVHTDILQVSPSVVDSLLNQLERENVTKIMPVVQDDEDMRRVDALLQRFRDRAAVSWGTHPVALPRRFGIVTAQGISKRQAARMVAEFHNIGMNELLGIGDSTSDWQFIEQCGYAGAMGNASVELKHLVRNKAGRSFIGKSVDENGILDILDHFGL